jgi:hypothetical protein
MKGVAWVQTDPLDPGITLRDPAFSPGFRPGSGRILRERIWQDGGAGYVAVSGGGQLGTKGRAGGDYAWNLATKYSEYAHPFRIARPPHRGLAGRGRLM